ncbi:MAG: hypothetical protein V1926_05135 [Candidatus Peregrinibacteria bacterium]
MHDRRDRAQYSEKRIQAWRDSTIKNPAFRKRLHLYLDLLHADIVSGQVQTYTA